MFESGLIEKTMTKNIEYLVDLLLLNILDQIWISEIFAPFV